MWCDGLQKKIGVYRKLEKTIELYTTHVQLGIVDYNMYMYVSMHPHVCHVNRIITLLELRMELS